MDTETETVQNDQYSEEAVDTSHMDEVVEQAEDTAQDQENETSEEQEDKRIPLSALQKERRKRQEWEQRAKFYEEMVQKTNTSTQETQESDEDEYEAVTKADLSKRDRQIIRQIEESNWIKQHPEKAEEVNENLKEFLNQRPHLATAIESCTNRYEEAWSLMNALSPKQKAALKVPSPKKKDAPGSPASVPRAAGMNQTIDVMNMSDDEFNKWRMGKRRAR